MPTAMTVDDVLSLNPCAAYSRSVVESLFGGRDTISVKDILVMPIPDLDKIWITSTFFLTSEQSAEITSGLLAQIDDPTSVEYGDFSKNGNPYSYRSLARYLARKNSQDVRTVVDRISASVISQIAEMV